MVLIDIEVTTVKAFIMQTACTLRASIFESRPLAFWVSVALVSIYTVRTINRRTTHKLPPGPKGLPFFGNLFQLSMRPWKEFEIWKKTGQYGKSAAHPQTLPELTHDWNADSLMYITALGRGILVLNSHKAAADLLDRRGHIYSDRPRFICEYMRYISLPSYTIDGIITGPVAMEIFTGGLLLAGMRYDEL